MISVVMATLNNAAELAEALSPLVPGSVDGLIHELVVADGGSTDDTLAVLDDAGAVLVEGGLGAACTAAKGPWLLIVEPSTRLPYEWIGPVRRHLESGDQAARKLVRSGWFAKPQALLILKRAWLTGQTGGKALRV